MKTLIALGAVLVISMPLLPAAQPAGTVTELHSCELYTGGCTASAEATLGGRSLLRVWTFESGSWKGVDLAGISVAALEVADDNLAANRDLATQAVVYLPGDASAAQQKALEGWLREQALGAKAEIAAVRREPIGIAGAGDTQAIRIGDIASVKTAALPACGTGACGEAMWYSPRSAHTGFRALMDETSFVNEPLLDLTLKSGGLRSVFLAAFGDAPRPLANAGL